MDVETARPRAHVTEVAEDTGRDQHGDTETRRTRRKSWFLNSVSPYLRVKACSASSVFLRLRRIDSEVAEDTGRDQHGDTERRRHEEFPRGSSLSRFEHHAKATRTMLKRGAAIF